MFKLNCSINKRVFLFTQVMFQTILLILNILIINKDIPLSKIYILFLFVISIINFENFYICILNSKKNLIFNSCIISIFSTVYIFITTFVVESWNYNLFKMIYLFVLIVQYIDIYTENLLSFKKIKCCIFSYFILLLIFKLINYSIFVTFFQLGYLLIGFLPFFILLENRYKLKQYGKYSFIFLIIGSIILLLFVVSPFFIDIPDISLTYLNEHFLIILLEILRIILTVIPNNGILKQIKFKIKFEKKILILVLIIVFYVILRDIANSIIISLMIYIQIELLYIFSKYKSIQNFDSKDLLTERIMHTEYFDKQLELHTEKIISFLHDEILQYIIIAIRELRNNEHCNKKNSVISLLEDTNLKIRQEINLYKPQISEEEKLCDVYYNLIKEIQNRFNNESILIDFQYEETLKLTKPYDIIIYQIIHELVVNIFKHSKGYYSEITVKSSYNDIFIEVKNIGDYMDTNIKKNIGNVGLRLLKFKVDSLGGKLDIYVNPNDLIEDKESDVVINVRIPIKKEVIYENFINRRS